MRLLLDESLPHRLVEPLGAAGHDATHIGAYDLLGAADPIVLQTAADERRVLLSADTDFGDLLAHGGLDGPSVVMLRRAPRTPPAIARLIVAALELLEEPLATGAVAVVTPTRVRYRMLPIIDRSP